MRTSAAWIGIALLLVVVAVGANAQEKLDLEAVETLVAEGKKHVDRSLNRALDATSRARARDEASAMLGRAYSLLEKWCEAHPEDLPTHEDRMVEIRQLQYQLRKESAVPIEEKPAIVEEEDEAEPGDTVEIPVGDLLRGRPERLPQKIVGGRPLPSGGFGFGFSEEEADDPYSEETWNEAMREGALDFGEIVALLEMMGVDDVEPDPAGYVLVPADSAADAARALARIRSHRPGFVDVQYRMAADTKLLLSGREPVPVGVTTVFADAAVSSTLRDWDVEIAQASEIPDPILWMQRTGTSLSLRVRPLPFAGMAVVEMRAVNSSPEKTAPIDLKHPDFGPVDRSAVVIEEAIVSFRVENGKPATHRFTGRHGRTVVIDLTVRWEDPTPGGGAGALLWTPLLTLPIHGFQMVPFQGQSAGAEVSEDWPMFGRVESREIPVDLLLGRATEDDVEMGGGQSGLAVFEGESAVAARDRAVREIGRNIGGATVALLAVDVPAGTAWSGEGELPEGARTVAEVAGPVLPDLSACFLGADLRNYVQDWDVEVAQASLIADPILSTVHNGHYLNVRLVPGIDGRAAEALLDLQFLKLDRIESLTVPIKILWGRGTIELTPSGKGTAMSGTIDGPGTKEERAEYTIEKPYVRELRISSALPLGRSGRAVLRRAAPGFLGEGRELVVVVTVK